MILYYIIRIDLHFERKTNSLSIKFRRSIVLNIFKFIKVKFIKLLFVLKFVFHMIVIYKIVTFKMTRKNIQELVDFLFF